MIKEGGYHSLMSEILLILSIKDNAEKLDNPVNE